MIFPAKPDISTSIPGHHPLTPVAGWIYAVLLGMLASAVFRLVTGCAHTDDSINDALPAKQLIADPAKTYVTNRRCPFIGAGDFVDLANQPGRVALIVDTRAASDYLAGHFPGAVWLGPDRFKRIILSPGRAARLSLARVETLSIAKKTGATRIPFPPKTTRDGSRVIVAGYRTDHTAAMAAFWLSRLGRAGTLPVTILDGGYASLSARGIALTTDHPTELDLKKTGWNPGDAVLSAQGIDEWIGGSTSKKPARNGYFIDTRPYDEYIGRAGRQYARNGRLPGSVWLNAYEFVDPITGCVLPKYMVVDIAAAFDIPGADRPVILIGSGDGDAYLSWWILSAAGVADTVILHGGYRVYSADMTHPVEKP